MGRLSEKEWLEQKKRKAIETCLRKKTYLRKSDAYITIKLLGMSKKLHPYECPVCAEWHIGHIIPKAQRMAP